MDWSCDIATVVFGFGSGVDRVAFCCWSCICIES